MHFREVELTEQDHLPYGKKYKDTKLANVPAWYLLWLYEKVGPRLPKNLLKYITDRYTLLLKEKDHDK